MLFSLSSFSELAWVYTGLDSDEITAAANDCTPLKKPIVY